MLGLLLLASVHAGLRWQDMPGDVGIVSPSCADKIFSGGVCFDDPRLFASSFGAHPRMDVLVVLGACCVRRGEAEEHTFRG